MSCRSPERKRRVRRTFPDSRIGSLLRRDIAATYGGAALGPLWALLQPIALIALFWFVFSVGLRIETVKGAPYVQWLIVGIVPWFYLSESFMRSAASILDHAYMLKKTAFPLILVPPIRCLAQLGVHLALVALTIVALAIAGKPPTLHILQLPYLLLCSLALTAGVSLLTAPAAIFFRDTLHILPIIVNAGFWLTPIAWPETNLPEGLGFLLLLNPFHHIVGGYRSAFLHEQWLWAESLTGAAVFWIICGSIFFLGAFVFRKLRPHLLESL